MIDQKRWLEFFQIAVQGSAQSTSQNEKKVLFTNQTTQIFYDTEGVLRIIFVKPIAEMRKANGFFDYTDKEQKLLNGQYWLDETWIHDAN